MSSRRTRLARGWALSMLLVLVAAPALAHEGAGAHGGFASGFSHPFGGLDHVVAMVAVGLWGAFLGAPAVWLLPVVFPVVMAFGGALGVAGIPVPSVEIGIALSAVVLGLMVAGAVKAPLWIAAIVVGTFAIFHGHAHGTELPGNTSALAYSAGFVVATGLLHLGGIAFSQLRVSKAGEVLVRAGGAAISLAGLAFLVA
ncbi:MAG: HupE/UreJ family protein [Hyphomicrobiaceae bacterium]